MSYGEPSQSTGNTTELTSRPAFALRHVAEVEQTLKELGLTPAGSIAAIVRSDTATHRSDTSDIMFMLADKNRDYRLTRDGHLIDCKWFPLSLGARYTNQQGEFSIGTELCFGWHERTNTLAGLQKGAEWSSWQTGACAAPELPPFCDAVSALKFVAGQENIMESGTVACVTSDAPTAQFFDFV
jgi:hypothetical protein